MNRLPHLLRWRPLLLCLTLAACGGGGGGGGDDASTGDGGSAAITATNLETVAGLAVSLVNADRRGAEGAGDALGGLRLTGEAGPIGAATALAVDSLRKFARSAAPPERSSAATISRTENCERAGSVRISLTSADDTLATLDAGDALVLDFRDCDQGESRIDGRLALSILSASGNLDSSGSARFQARFTDLRISDGDAILTTNGNLQVSVSVSAGVITTELDSSGVAYAISLAGEVLSLTIREGSVSFTDELLSGTTLTVGEDFVAIAPGFAGGAVLSTDTPLLIDPAGQFVAGRLRVRGLDSVLLMTFLEAGELLLELDDDNDGLIDLSRPTRLPLLPFALP